MDSTVRALAIKLTAEGLSYDIVVVNDHSNDSTETILQNLATEFPGVRYINNDGLGGFGHAVRCGLDRYAGDVVAVYMADASDTPEDLVRFYRALVEQNVDCVFGTRFHPESRVVDYPWFKLILNRLFNKLVQVTFRLDYNDVTNAFKLYSRHVIDGTRPHLSYHFNLTVELPLKAIVRGYTFTVIPNDWINRKTGESKLKLKEMGSRYLFILFYCLIEKWLSRGDYRRRDAHIEADA